MSCSLLFTCWERADLLALLYEMFSCVFVTFPYGVLGQVWYLIVSIPDLCILPYFLERKIRCNTLLLLEYLQEITEAIGNGKDVGVIYLDFCKASMRKCMEDC